MHQPTRAAGDPITGFGSIDEPKRDPADAIAHAIRDLHRPQPEQVRVLLEALTDCASRIDDTVYANTDAVINALDFVAMTLDDVTLDPDYVDECRESEDRLQQDMRDDLARRSY